MYQHRAKQQQNKNTTTKKHLCIKAQGIANSQSITSTSLFLYARNCSCFFGRPTEYTLGRAIKYMPLQDASYCALFTETKCFWIFFLFSLCKRLKLTLKAVYFHLWLSCALVFLVFHFMTLKKIYKNGCYWVVCVISQCAL